MGGLPRVDLKYAVRRFDRLVPRKRAAVWHPASAASRRQCRGPQLPLGRGTATNTAETQEADRAVGEATGGKLRERRLGPALAARAVQTQGVIVLDQVGDGVQVDGGGHRRPRVRPMRAQGVSLVWRGDTRASDAAAQGW